MFSKRFAVRPAVLLASMAVAAAAVTSSVSSYAADNTRMAMAHGDKHISSKFEGVKANTGTVTHYTEDGKQVLTLSDDFKVPDTPAPHWQVVDSQGNTYLLQRLVVKGDKLNKTIVLPSYIKNVAKVQIWCAYAEVLLGEARFSEPVM